MLLNFLRDSIKSPFYYIKKRFIKALNIHLAIIYRFNNKITIKKIINLFITDFIKLKYDEIGI